MDGIEDSEFGDSFVMRQKRISKDLVISKT